MMDVRSNVVTLKVKRSGIYLRPGAGVEVVDERGRNINVDVCGENEMVDFKTGKELFQLQVFRTI